LEPIRLSDKEKEFIHIRREPIVDQIIRHLADHRWSFDSSRIILPAAQPEDLTVELFWDALLPAPRWEDSDRRADWQTRTRRPRVEVSR